MSTQNFDKPFVYKKKHRVPYGIPESSINFTDETAMSNLETIVQRYTQLVKIPYQDAFECFTRIVNMKCFICHRGLELDNIKTAFDPSNLDINPHLLGAGVYCYPTDISDEERERQSKEQIEHNQRKTAKLEEMHQEIEKSEDTVLKNTYNPYPICSKPSSVIIAPKINDKKRLRIEMTRAILCMDCRNKGQSGGKNVITECRIPNLQDRNAINKWRQAGYKIAEFQSRELEENEYIYYREPITDRFTFYFGLGSFPIDNIMSQLCLFQSKDGNILQRTLFNYGSDSKQFIKEGCQGMSILFTLMRSATETMMKSDKKDPGIQEFENAFTLYLRIVRIALEFLKKYPQLKDKIARMVYKWNANPFSKEARYIFDHYLDVIFASSFVEIPFAIIRRSILLVTFEQTLINFNVTQDKIDKKDMITFLRQLFNEGRSRKTVRQLLYMISFTGIFRSIGNVSNMITIMDKHAGTLPWSRYIEVWKDMQYCNSQVTSFEPIEQNNERLPGLWLHLGMEDPLITGSDDRQVREHIYKFMCLLLKNTGKWRESHLPPDVEAAIDRMGIQHRGESHKQQQSVVCRAEELSKIEKERLEKEYMKHKGYPDLPSGGHVSMSGGKCLYSECGRQFKSGRELSEHLHKCIPQLHDFCHVHHRNLINMKNLTKQHVLDENIVECPYIHCSTNHMIKTAQDLCDHFCVLGIHDFWIKGCTVPIHPGFESKQTDVIDEQQSSSEPIVNDFDNPGFCVSCIDKPCDVMIVQCGHINMCNDCLNQWCIAHNGSQNDYGYDNDDGTPCPSCRGPIDGKIPLAMAISYVEMNDTQVYFSGL